MPRRSLIEGSVSPAAISVTVPTRFPALEQEAAGWGDLSNRASQFSNMLGEIAGKRAKAKGAAYGARTAPTADQLTAMKNLGQPVTLQGDPGSLNIYEQNVYAAQLAVTEDRYELLGRKAINELIAQGADPNGPYATPDKFQNALETVVTEYSEVMSAISPSSGAKVGHSLGLLANSAVLSFSRTYMEKQIDADQADAMASIPNFIGEIATIVSGHNAVGAEERQALLEAGRYEEFAAAAVGDTPSLMDKLDALRTRMETSLSGRVTGTKLKSALNDFDKVSGEVLVNEVANWAFTTPFQTADEVYNPHKWLTQNKLDKLPPNIREIWEGLDGTQRFEALKRVTKISGDIHQRINDASELARKAGEDRVDSILIEMGEIANLDERDEEALKKLFDELRDTPQATRDQINAARLMLEQRETVAVSRADVKTKLERLNELNQLKPIDVSQALAAGDLTNEDAGNFYEGLRLQRDRLVKRALDLAAVEFQPDFQTPRRQLTAEKQLQNTQYKEFERRVIEDRKNWEAKLATALREGADTPEGFYDPTTPELLKQNIEQATERGRNAIIIQKYGTLDSAVRRLQDAELIEGTPNFESQKGRDTARKIFKSILENDKQQEQHRTAASMALEAMKDLKELKWPTRP
tara:strand:+ start:607 stop:2526 length:1920 start_codon:yes stop_codon:yes gene_type:complete